jgi:hypothetical protein
MFKFRDRPHAKCESIHDESSCRFGDVTRLIRENELGGDKRGVGRPLLTVTRKEWRVSEISH